jgi:hypothetical protein
MNTGHCFQCEAENPADQLFCGQCGSALTLKDYISGQISKEIADAIRDRDVLETESAIRVFERAWGWATLVRNIFAVAAGTVLAVVLVVAGWVGWKALDFSKTADGAKTSVVETANSTKREISRTSEESLAEIRTSTNSATEANRTSSANAALFTKEIKTSAAQTKAELKNEAASVRTEVTNSTTELEAVKKLQPEFESMRAQLGKATSNLAEQQKVISSSEDFVKHVFSTHATYFFTFEDFVRPNAVVIPAPPGIKNSVVLMLLPNSPIPGTLQLQYKIYVQPANSYFQVHNMIVFFWGDPPGNLKTESLVVSYFPDKSDKETIKTLSIRDGRTFADDEPLPKFGQPDPDWKGDKWFPAPKPATAKP